MEIHETEEQPLAVALTVPQEGHIPVAAPPHPVIVPILDDQQPPVPQRPGHIAQRSSDLVTGQHVRQAVPQAEQRVIGPGYPRCQLAEPRHPKARLLPPGLRLSTRLGDHLGAQVGAIGQIAALPQRQDVPSGAARCVQHALHAIRRQERLQDRQLARQPPRPIDEAIIVDAQVIVQWHAIHRHLQLAAPPHAAEPTTPRP